MSIVPTLLYPLVFGLTLFVSSALLFFVQPMVGKVLLPRLGGTPAVWNTCLVFFQAALLAGYAYGHVLSWPRGVRWQTLVHVALLAVPVILLFGGVIGWTGLARVSTLVDGTLYPVLSTLVLLGIVVGLPVFVVSSTAPLLQRWFAGTAHPAAEDPYFLYAASNLGSLAALACYPLLVEPRWHLDLQQFIWTAGYLVMAGLIVLCAVLTWLAPRRLAPRRQAPARPAQDYADVPADTPLMAELVGLGEPTLGKPTLLRRLRWLVCAAVPASLLLGFTTFWTTDVAPIPLFWAVPLALYLFTFVLAFARFSLLERMPFAASLLLQVIHGALIFFLLVGKVLVPANVLPAEYALGAAALLTALILAMPYRWGLVLQPIVAAVMVFFLIQTDGSFNSLVAAVHLLAFFLTARVCHGELARDRPAAPYVTGFFFWVAVGGLVGGVFNLLLAPLVFQRGLVEYPLAAVVGCMLRPAWLTNGAADWVLLRLVEGGQRVGQATQQLQRKVLAFGFDLLVPIVLSMLILGILAAAEAMELQRLFQRWDRGGSPLLYNLVVFGSLVLLCLTVVARPIRFGLTLAALLLVHAFYLDYDRRGRPDLLVSRTPFGVLRVKDNVELDRRQAAGLERQELQSYQLVHGHINHGMNFQDPSLRRYATTYYHRRGPAGIVLEKYNWFPGPPNTYWADTRMPASLAGLGASALAGGNLPFAQLVGAWSEPPIAVVGLGVGTLASYARPFQRVDFYELDKGVIDLCMPPPGKRQYFHYLRDAHERGAHIKVIYGDGRLTLARQGPDRFYQLIFVDAFSSDAIPMHLLTREAMQLYFQKLAPGGMVCLHTSNRYVDLPPILGDIANHLGYAAMRGHDTFQPEGDQDLAHYTSEWVMLARNHKDLLTIDLRDPRDPREGGQAPPWPRPGARLEPLWQPLLGGRGPIWTDDYSNLAAALRSDYTGLFRLVLVALLALVAAVALAEIIAGIVVATERARKTGGP